MMTLKPLDSPHMLAHALAYARRGLKVFPVYEPVYGACSCGNPDCQNIGKHPRTKHGLSEATADKNQISAWWNKWPEANIGLSMNNLICVDIDADKDGYVSLEKIETEFGKLPDTLKADTGGGGQHYIFNRSGAHCKNGQGLLPGIDLKTDGGYVVASPSLHKSGRRYKWGQNCARTLAELPAPLLAFIAGNGKHDSPEKKDPASILDGVAEGQRDDALFRYACTLQRKGLSKAEAKILLSRAASKCRPPFLVWEQKVDSAYSYQNNTDTENPFTPQPYWRQFDVSDIEKWECPELEPIIEGIIAKGNLLWLAAETQTGKTLFMLWVCLQLLHKGMLFDKFAIIPVKRILYVACEDPARRFKARLLDMLPSAIEAGRFVIYVAPGLSIADPLCFQFLESMIQEGGFDFVVLDTFQAATMGISSFDDEKLSIVIRRLLEITRKQGTTIVVNDHFRKTQTNKKRADFDLNDVKGSGAKLQNSDVFLLMDRRNGQLRISGKSKEWDRPIGFLLDIVPQGTREISKFIFAGDLEQFASGSKKRGDITRGKIIEVMRGIEWVSSREIAFKTGLSEPTVRRHLNLMLSDKLIAETGQARLTRYQLSNQSQGNT
jgi:hypothetical protein